MGRFIGVVGPSGAGKDSLIDAARAMLGEDRSVRFVRRVITRPEEAGGEDHEAVTVDEFEAKVAQGRFALHWGAHGLRYGLPLDIDETIQSGRSVLANLSRSVIPQVRALYPQRRFIVVTASPSILAARLAARGRETAEDIEHRLSRAVQDMPAGEDIETVVNDGDLAEAAARFIDLITHR